MVHWLLHGAIGLMRFYLNPEAFHLIEYTNISLVLVRVQCTSHRDPSDMARKRLAFAERLLFSASRSSHSHPETRTSPFARVAVLGYKGLNIWIGGLGVLCTYNTSIKRCLPAVPCDFRSCLAGLENTQSSRRWLQHTLQKHQRLGSGGGWL